MNILIEYYHTWLAIGQQMAEEKAVLGMYSPISGVHIAFFSNFGFIFVHLLAPAIIIGAILLMKKISRHVLPDN